MANKFSSNRVYTIDDIRKEKLGDNYVTYADREKELKAIEEKERLAREQAERDKAMAKAEQDQRLLDSISQPTNPLDRIRGIADMAGFKMMDAQKEEPLVSRPIQQTTGGAIAPSSGYQSIGDIPQYEQNFGQGAIGVDSATMKRMEADELKRQSKYKEAFEKSGATNFSRFIKGVEKQKDVGTSFMDYATEGALEAGRGIINTLYNVSRENLQRLEEQRYENLKKYMPDMKEPEPFETKDLLKKTSRQMGIEAQRQSEREQMGKFRGFVEDVKQGGASMVFPLLISGATGGLSSSSLLSPSTQSKITSGLSKVFGSKMSTGLVNRIAGVLSKRGLASSVAIGGQSGGQAAQRALDQGATGSEALTTGTLVGGAEALTEQLFGLVPGLDNLGNKLDNLTGNRKADAFKIVAGLLKNSLEEGGEEVIMGIVEPLITDKVYGSGDKIDLKEVGYQGLIGFILGGIMAGGQAVGQVSESRDIARQEQQGVLERFNLQNNEVVKEMQNVGELVFGTLDSNERMQLLDNASNNLDQIIGLYNDIAIGNKPIDGVDVNKTNASKIAIELNIIKGILDNKRIETQRELMLKLPAQGETTQTIEGQLQAKADSMPSMQDMTAQQKSPFDLPQQTVPMTNKPLPTINELMGKPNVNLPMMEGELVPQVKADRQEITTQQQPQAEPTTTQPSQESEFTPEENKQIKEAGKKEYQSYMKRKTDRMYTAETRRADANKAKQRAELEESQKIREYKKDQSIRVADRRAREKEVQDTMNEVETREKLKEPAIKKGFRAATVFDFVNQDTERILNDIKNNKVKVQEVVDLIEFARANGYVTDDYANLIKDSLPSQQPQAEPTKQEEQQPQQSNEVKKDSEIETEPIESTEYKDKKVIDDAVDKGLEDISKPFKPAKFKKEKIFVEVKIEGEFKKIQIPAETYKGLAIHNLHEYGEIDTNNEATLLSSIKKGKYVMTHVNSGLGFSTGIKTNRTKLKEFIQRLADATDFNVTGEQVTEYFKDDDFKSFYHDLKSYVFEATKDNITLEGTLQSVRSKEISNTQALDSLEISKPTVKIHGLDYSQRKQLLTEIINKLPEIEEMTKQQRLDISKKVDESETEIDKLKAELKTAKEKHHIDNLKQRIAMEKETIEILKARYKTNNSIKSITVDVRRNGIITVSNDDYSINKIFKAIGVELLNKKGVAPTYNKQTKEQQPPKKEQQPTKTETQEQPQQSEVEYSKEDIDYKMALNAHNGTSHTPDVRAKGVQDEYVKTMDYIVSTYLDNAPSDKREAVVNAINAYKERYLKTMRAYLSSRNGFMSTMITGASNFPARRMEKKSEVIQKRLEEHLSVIEKAEKNIKKALSGKDKKVGAKEEIIALVDEALETVRMIENNENGFGGYNASLFKKGLQDKLERRAYNGKTQEVAYALEYLKEKQKGLKKPFFSPRNKIWSVIERASAKVEELKKETDKTTVEGVDVVRNTEADRLQLLFDGKPEPEVISDLKSSGWRWSPKAGAWQRKLTDNAERSAKGIIEKHYQQKDINKIKEVADKRIENNIQKAAKKPSSLLTQETSEYAEKLKWDKNFPKLINMTNLPALKNKKNGNLKLHEKAKTGDVEAAYELVKNLYKEERIIEIGKNYPNAILVPVHAEESTGENAIPVVYADRISILTGLEVDDNIVQTNRAKRTEKTKQQRLFQKVTFYGEVKAGRDYIIVDDVVTQGGTIRGLKEHIIKNGGNVVAITALAPGQARPTQISITEGTIDALKRRFGYDELTNAIKEFGVAKSIEELTEAEGRDIYSGFGDVKSFRDTATKEKQERNAKEGKRALREREVLKAAKKTKPLMETKKIKGPSDKKGIVRRSDIEEFLSKNLDIPIRQGKFSQKAYGIFKVKPEVIRLRKTKDIETLFHEVGHFFDKKYRLSNPSFDNELIDLGKETSLPSYTKEQVRKEGVAEFFRYFIIRPDLAKQKAPRFYDYFTTKTSDNPDLKVMFDYLKTAVKDYQNQSATNRVLSNVAVDRKINKFNIKEFFNKMLTMFDDELGEIDRAVKKMVGNIKLPASKDPYKLAYLYKGWAGKAETYLEYGIVNRKGEKISKGLKEILEPVADDLNDLRAYLVAKRVIELKDRNIESGIILEDANEAIREQSGKGFDKVAKELVEYQNMIAQQLVDAGIISQDKFNSMKKLNQNYVPFYRVMDDDVKRGHGRGMQSYNPIHNIKGSTRDIIDPLTSIIKNTYLLTDISERNYVGKSLVDIANRYDGTGKFLDKVPSSMIPRSFTLSEIKNVLDGAGADLETIDLENIATIFRPASPKGNVLTVYKNGKPQYYEIFDKELYKAMMSLNSESTDTFIKMLSIPARTLRTGAIATLDFAARNPLRDTLTAGLYNDYGFIPIVDTVRGIYHALKKDDVYYNYMSSGSMGSMLQTIDHEYAQENLQQLVGKGFQSQYTNPLYWLGKIGDITEKGTRIGIMQRGKSKAEREDLAFSSRRASMDFARLGSAMKNINKVVPFSGAQEEGVSRFIREFTPRKGANGKLDFSRPLSLLIRSLLLITLPSMALFFKNKDNPYYQELPQWRKDLFWNIPIDGAPFNFIMLPKPFLEGVIFGAVPERAMQYLYSKDKKAFAGLEDSFRDATLPDFIPTALKPIIENITNYSFFGQRNIVPQSEEKLEPYMQYGKYTSETAKALGRVFNYSPRKIDNLFRGYGGGLARYVTDTIDKGLAITGTIDEDVFPRDVKKYPIARSFMSTALTTYTQSIEDFYNELNSMEREYSTTKAKDEIGGLDQYHRAEELRKYRKLNSYLSEKRTQIYDMQDAKVPDATINEEIVKMLNLVREERGMLQLDTDIKYGDLENKYLYESTRQDILNQAEKTEKIPKHLIDEALESAGFSRQKLNEATEKLKAENYELAMRYLRDAEIPLEEKVNLIKQIDKANNKLDANKIINDLFK